MHNIDYIEEKDGVNRDEVMREIQGIAARNGDGYHGGLKWHSEIPVLEDRAAAERKIKELDKGWYSDHAVRFYSYENATETKKMHEIREKIKEIQAKREKYIADHSVVKFRAEFLGCPNCKSKVARTFLRGNRCPVCGKDLRAKTTLDTIERYGKRIDELWEKHEDEKKKQIAKREVRWLIKYEYHS